MLQYHNSSIETKGVALVVPRKGVRSLWSAKQQPGQRLFSLEDAQMGKDIVPATYKWFIESFESLPKEEKCRLLSCMISPSRLIKARRRFRGQLYNELRRRERKDG